jgi:parallel beta-helix repeat protein
LNGGAHNNIVGGADAATRNLIAGNEHSGVLIQGSNSHHNTIAGNWIGVSTNGQAALKNAVAGIMIEGGAHDNQIGGALQGNLISGNDTGIYLDGGIATTIAGNIIGLAADGHTQLGNTNGGILMVRGAQNNVIGGIDAEMRNVIAGNGTSVSAFGQGIYLSDLNTVNNTIQGNYIGVDSSGNLPAGNYRQGILVGVGAQGNIIGGTGAGEGNVIAYNGLGGIRIDAPDNQVAGNLIGVGANRTTQIGNQYNGVRVVGDHNTIGPDNLIAYNQQSGILISGSATTVLSNTLKSNARSGICVAGPNNIVQGNRIESNGDGAGPWSECPVRGGIVITSTNGTLVSDNDILSNNDAGVTVYGGSGNSILTNSISGNRTAGILLKSGGNNGLTPPHLDAVTNTMVSGTACPLCRVEVFIDDSDEGKVFLGATNAASDGTFSRSISPAAAPGEHYTATHTDSNGNTSSFAPAVSVPAPPGPPTPTPTPGTTPPRPPVLPARQYVPIVRF